MNTAVRLFYRQIRVLKVFMRFYLSSYKLGNETQRLIEMIPNGRIGYISNALDFSGADQNKVKERVDKDMNSLQELGTQVELINLHDYFGKHDELKKKVEELGAIFISGGNVFVLRQAMKLSGLDEILKELLINQDFLYAGYSAAGCVLAPNLKPYEIADPVDTPYAELKDVIWEGLGFVDFNFMPHWNSDHPESALIEKEIQYCEQNNIPYKAIRDGEVTII
ncbi:MAG: Type 1 glutamine amidotransferase-like domain-containing protein [Candidatus Andersenbacteria bacterium]|nr:Type 1 glutamine amidotransferase-like domain-containing protein [Candidatus Andersenbacteria bacterium]